MARANLQNQNTHQPTVIDAEAELRRALLAVQESHKDEYGRAAAGRIAALVPRADAAAVAALAIEARERMHLRHLPLLLVREMARHPSHRMLVAETLECVIQRADELTEFVVLYWKDGRRPLSAQVKKGLAAAFTKFDAWQLASVDRTGPVRLRDVLFLCHARPRDLAQEVLWRQLADGTLPLDS